MKIIKLISIGLLALASTVSAQFTTAGIYAETPTGPANIKMTGSTITSQTVILSGAVWFPVNKGIVYNGDSTIYLSVTRGGKLVYEKKEVITLQSLQDFKYDDPTAPWLVDHKNMVKSLTGLAQGLPFYIKIDWGIIGSGPADITIKIKKANLAVTWDVNVVTTGISDLDILSKGPELVSSSLMWGTSNVYLETYSDGSRRKVLRLE